MLELKTDQDLQNHWRNFYAQWWAAGMPSYASKNAEPWKQLRIKFRTREDREHFAELYGYKLTDRTNSVWFPMKEAEKNRENRYIEEGHEESFIEYDQQDLNNDIWLTIRRTK